MSDNPPPSNMPPAQRTGPECGNEPETCRLTTVSQVQEPLIEWTPEYNGIGQMVNSDPNTFISTITCSACDGEWQDTRSVAGGTTRAVTKAPRTL